MKKVGSVNEAEKNEILSLHERIQSLNKLILVFQDEDNEIVRSELWEEGLYERVISDLEKTTTLFNRWWQRMGDKYNWMTKENAKWSIDFKTKEICLEEIQQ